jgi:hypothetical protein
MVLTNFLLLEKCMSFNNRGNVSIMAIVAAFGIAIVFWLQPAAAQPDAKKDRLAPIPTVFALVRLPKADPLLPEPEQARNGADKADELMKRNAMTLVKSRDTLSAALRQDPVRALAILQKQQNQVAWLEKVLEVDFPNDGDIMRIGMNGSNPEEMAILVNAIVEAFAIRRKTEAQKKEADRAITLEKVCMQQEEKIRTATGVLRRLGEELKISDSPLNKQMQMQSLQDCTRELRRVRLERVALQVQLARKPADQDDGKEFKPGSKRFLEEQSAILAEQEKLLAEEVKDLRMKADRGAIGIGSFDIEFRQEEIDADKKVLRRLREEKARLHFEKLDPVGNIFVVQRAEAPNP